MPQQLTVGNAEAGQEYAGGIWLCSKKVLDLQQSWQEPLFEQLLLKKPYRKGRSALMEDDGHPHLLVSIEWKKEQPCGVFTILFLWHVGLSSCQECARGVLPERAVDNRLQPGAAGGQHGAALRPWLGG